MGKISCGLSYEAYKPIIGIINGVGTSEELHEKLTTWEFVLQIFSLRILFLSSLIPHVMNFRSIPNWP